MLKKKLQNRINSMPLKLHSPESDSLEESKSEATEVNESSSADKDNADIKSL